MAWLYAEEERNLNEALRLVEEALFLEPDTFAFLDTKAEVLYKMGRFKEAITIADDLVIRYPSSRYAKEQLEKFINEYNNVLSESVYITQEITNDQGTRHKQ